MKSAYINSVNLNQETDFPYLVLNVTNENSSPRNPGFQVMHWHEDLQFIYVLDGEIEVLTLSEHVRLQKENGIFINKNVVHLIRKIDFCHYNSFIFPDRFLKFYAGGPAERMVERVVGREELPIYVIRNTEAERPLLKQLHKLSLLEKEKTELYPYEVLCTMCNLWLAFLRTVPLPEKQRTRSVSEERVAIFLRYIAEHFGEDISLNNLAASAAVSKSECLRCFKSVMNTTPYQYIGEFRLSKAAERLRQTDDSISAVATECGFNHLSHFGKCFREKTGMSPGEYKKRMRSTLPSAISQGGMSTAKPTKKRTPLDN